MNIRNLTPPKIAPLLLLICSMARAAPSLADATNLISNGDFERASATSASWPDSWGRPNSGGSYEVEAGNHFLRLTSDKPGATVLLYRLIDITPGVKAVELKWRQRVTDLKPGKEAWFDARIMMHWKDAAGQPIADTPPAPYERQSTAGWVEKHVSFLVPPGARTLEFMPALLQVETGTFDLDDISLKPVDAAPLMVAAAKAAADATFSNMAAEAPNKANWPPMLHVAGNRVMTASGKEVLLRGVNVVSLEWNPQGERVMRNTQVAIDDWKSNTIRLPVKEDYWFGKEAGQTDGGAGYRSLVDKIVIVAANRGAYVLLDLHRFHAPSAIHAAFWKDAAARYKDHPAVLFDVFNEPHGTTWEVWRNGGFMADQNAPADEDAFLSPAEKALNAKGFHAVGIQALIDAVRGTGAKNIVVAGGLDWAYDLSGIDNGFALDDRGGNGIIYASHIYAAKRDWLNKVLLVADKYPIIVSEFGANTQKFTFIPADQQEDASTFVPRVLGFIQKYHLHWTAFCLHPSAAPRLITGWDYTPTPEWGALAKAALAGKKFSMGQLR